MISRLGVTSIFVTHDQDEAIEVADEIIITNKGRIEQIGTPIDVYRHPHTAFTASFFGQPAVVSDYSRFKTFEKRDDIDAAYIRPEFVRVTKQGEEEIYKSSVSKGIVEEVSFRGDSMELKVRTNGYLLTAKRRLDEDTVEAGEQVNVFIYRMFAASGEKAYLLKNKALTEDSVVI